MRKVVAIEGVQSHDRRFLMPGSMVPDDNAIPVWLRNGVETLVGLATEFYRDDDTGELSFVIYTEHEDVDLNKYHAHIYITDYVGIEKGPVLEIHHGIIRGIYFSHEISNWDPKR